MTLRVALVIDGDSAGAKKAADETSRAIGGLQQQARGAAAPLAAAAGATRQLSAENDNLAKAMRGASGALAVMPGTIGQVGTGLGLAALGIGAATTAAIGMAAAIGGKAVDAFRQLEKEQATYNGVIRATGMAAGRTGDDIEALAAGIRQASTATEGEMRSAAAIMLTFRSVTGETFDDAMKLSQDLAAVGFGSVSSAATMMGKALEDPERGLTALRRVGVSFSETQQRVIKNFIEMGQEGKAQRLILEGVRQQVGGAGAAQGNTLAGATNQLAEATNNLLERWGAQIVKGTQLDAVIRGIAGAIDQANKAAEGAASPEGQLAAARAALERLQSNPNAGRQRAGMPRDTAIGLAEERVKAAQAAVEIDNLARAQGRLIASNAEFEASEDSKYRKFSDTLGRIKDDIKDLQGTALERAVAAELKAAGLNKLNVTDPEGKDLESRARAERIRGIVTERFELKEGVQMMQARVAALGSAANETDKLKAKEADLTLAVREGTLSQQDYKNAIGAFKLESIIGQEERRLGLLGDLARVQDVVANSQREINLARAGGILISKDEEAAILSRTRILTESQRFENQLAFERAQLSRTAIEQRIAQELRTRGVNPGSREGRDRARDIRELEELRITKDLLDDVIGGGMRDLMSDLRQGANLWDALGKSGMNALGRLSDKLLKMAMDDLLAKAFGGVNLFSLLGLGGSTAAGGGGSAGGTGFSLTRTGGLYDAGGYTGDIGRGEVAGLVHGREFVVNADATARHLPLLTAINDNRLPGYAAGGYVGPPPRGAGGGGGTQVAVGPPVVNIHNYTGQPVGQRQNADGSLDVIIGQMVNDAVGAQVAAGRGPVTRAIDARLHNQHLRG